MRQLSRNNSGAGQKAFPLVGRNSGERQVEDKSGRDCGGGSLDGHLALFIFLETEVTTKESGVL